MYKLKKEYDKYEMKEEIKDHLPEWIRLLQDYFRKNYYSSPMKSNAKASKK